MAPVRVRRHRGSVKRRLAAGLLWSIVVLWAGGYVALYVGVPATLHLPLAIAAGAFVGFDPLGRIWPSKTRVPASTPNGVELRQTSGARP